MSTPANNPNQTTADWGECPAGELQGLGQSLRQRHAKKQQARLAGTVLPMIVVLLAAWCTIDGGGARNADPQVASITCEQCFAQFEQYHAHLTDSQDVPEEIVATTESHLAYCEKCRDKFDEVYPGVAVWTSITAAGLALLAWPRRERGS